MIVGAARRPGGYAIWTGDDGVTERDSFTCGHCGNVRFIRPRFSVAEAPDFCRTCMKVICQECADRRAHGYECDPFEKKLERIEARDRFRRQLAGDYR